MAIPFFPRIKSRPVFQVKFPAARQVTASIVSLNLAVKKAVDAFVAWMEMKNSEREQAAFSLTKQVAIERSAGQYLSISPDKDSSIVITQINQFGKVGARAKPVEWLR